MADTKYTIRQGESEVFEIPVYNEDGTPYDVSTSDVTNILVTLSNKGVIFQKYSLQNMGSDFGTIDRTGNVIKILVEREQSKLWDTGYVSATVTVEKNDTLLGHKVDDFEVTDFIEVLPSVNKDFILP